MASIDQLLGFGDYVLFFRLARVDVPILVVQSRADDVVDPISSELIYHAVRSRTKELRWIDAEEHASHILTTFEYPSRATIFGWVADFIARVEGLGTDRSDPAR